MTDPKLPQVPDSPAGHTPALQPDATRRRLAGLGVTAVFTLASRPVLAGTCNSPSAHASGNMSFRGEPPVCSGRTPAGWRGTVNGNNPNNGFPGGNVDFSAVFANGNGVNWPGGGNGRLYMVMGETDNNNANPTPNPISKEFAATLLSIRDNRIPATVLDEGKLINMWVEWRTTGSFKPKAGVSWNAGAIIDYLRALQA